MRFGIIGYGNMAGAIVDGVLSAGLFTQDQIRIFDPSHVRREVAEGRGLLLAKSNMQLVEDSDLILLSVKPQVCGEVLSEIASVSTGKCFVSIAAGVSTRFLHSVLGEQVYCVRVMPNTPMMLRCGAIAIAREEEVPDVLFQQVCAIFSAAGSVEIIDESLMDEIVGVNGSSPAFFFRLAEIMENIAEEQGIDRMTARRLIAKTMEGSALMLQQGERSPEELRRQVSSPGGTTLSALSAFEEYNFEGLMREAMLRCTRRSRELGQKKHVYHLLFLHRFLQEEGIV